MLSLSLSFFLLFISGFLTYLKVPSVCVILRLLEVKPFVKLFRAFQPANPSRIKAEYIFVFTFSCPIVCA